MTLPVDADGTKVSQADAMAAWAVDARQSLLMTARRYHSVITYKGRRMPARGNVR